MIYATFINRAFDQLLLDVALPAAVTFVLDQAGITGPDGPGLCGIWTIHHGVVPAAAGRPGTATPGRSCGGISGQDGPTVIRFPTGAVRMTSQRSGGSAPWTLVESDSGTLLVAVGIRPPRGQTANRLAEQGYGVAVVDRGGSARAGLVSAGVTAAGGAVKDGVRSAASATGSRAGTPTCRPRCGTSAWRSTGTRAVAGTSPGRPGLTAQTLPGRSRLGRRPDPTLSV